MRCGLRRPTRSMRRAPPHGRRTARSSPGIEAIARSGAVRTLEASANNRFSASSRSPRRRVDRRSTWVRRMERSGVCPMFLDEIAGAVRMPRRQADAAQGHHETEGLVAARRRRRSSPRAGGGVARVVRHDTASIVRETAPDSADELPWRSRTFPFSRGAGLAHVAGRRIRILGLGLNFPGLTTSFEQRYGCRSALSSGDLDDVVPSWLSFESS